MLRNLLFIIFNSLVILIFVRFLPPQLKVDIRFALFTHYLNTEDYFDIPFAQIKKAEPYFRVYKEKYLRKILADHKIIPIAFDDSTSYINRAKTLALIYSKNGGHGCGSYSDDLIANIKWLSEQHGCCSDHSQVFIAFCLSNNIFARELHHRSHTFNEYFDTQLDKWVWVDTQYCLMAKDSMGNFLSFHEIHKSFENNEKINWEFFGGETHQLYKQKDYNTITNYFNKEEFSYMAMTLGNNVFEVDYYNKKLSFLPRELRQLLLLSVGIQPHYLAYDPNDYFIGYWKSLKFKVIAVFSAIVLTNILILFPSIKYRFTNFLHKHAH